MSQITIRQLPELLEKQLRLISGQNKTSLNKTIISLLMTSLGLNLDSQKKRNLSELAGTWSDENYLDFLKNTEGFEKIDPDVWE